MEEEVGRERLGDRETKMINNMEKTARGQISAALREAVKTSAFTPREMQSHWKALSTR